MRTSGPDFGRKAGRRHSEGGMFCSQHNKPVIGCVPTINRSRLKGGPEVEWARPVCVDCKLSPISSEDKT